MNNIEKIPLHLVIKYEPKSEWLAHESLVHGVDHLARVFIFQELICNQLESQNIAINREALRWASSTHDVGRIDDGLDLDHGKRSAQWIKGNLADQMSAQLLDTVTYIVRWHVPSDDEAPVMTTELKVLKDADALDRVRLGDLDVRFLRTDAARSLVETAERLYHMYEKIESEDPFMSVVKAAQGIGIVSKN